MPTPDRPEAQTLTAGVAVERWKVPIFHKRLKTAGYDFEKAVGGTEPLAICVIKVKTDDPLALKTVLEECQAEASRKGPGNGSR